MFVKIFKVLRIDNWLKNLIIFFPYLLSGKFLWGDILNLSLVFLYFSLVVSSTYIVNDFLDIHSDKLHPTKKDRPIAAGYKTKKFWLICAFSSFIVGQFFLFQMNASLLTYSFSYVVITISYSLYLKYTKYFDILSIASLFLIRLFLGGAATNTQISFWLISFIFFNCLGLVSGKKLSILLNADIQHSKIKDFLTNSYKEAELRQLIKISFIFCVIIFSFWIFFVNYFNVVTSKILVLSSSLFCLIYFLMQFYSSSVIGETEDIVKNIQNKNNFFSLALFLILILWGIS